MMARKSQHNLPPGIQLDQHGAYWATLEGEDAKLWRKRHVGRSLPRRKAKDLREALKLQRLLIADLKAGRDSNADNPKVADWVRTCIDRKRDLVAHHSDFDGSPCWCYRKTDSDRRESCSRNMSSI
jgi:hypothetical protein